MNFKWSLKFYGACLDADDIEWMHGYKEKKKKIIKTNSILSSLRNFDAK